MEMQLLQNILVFIAIGAAAVYLLRATLISLGVIDKAQGTGCGSCAACPTKTGPDVVEITWATNPHSQASNKP